MKSHKTKGIVLKKIPYSEKDLIVVWLTDTGKKITGFAPAARQSRRRFGGALDLLNYLEFVYREGRNADAVRLEGVNLLAGMEGVRKDLSKFAAACYFSEVILEFVQEKQQIPAIFGAYFDFLLGLNKSGEFKSHVVPLMEHKFLTILGFKPWLSECLLCKKALSPQESYFFDGRRGGVVCSECTLSKENGNGAPSSKRHRKDLEPGSPRPNDMYPLGYSVIRQILKAHEAHPEEWDSLSFKPQEVLQARNAFEYFIQYTAGKPLKSLRFLSQILT